MNSLRKKIGIGPFGADVATRQAHLLDIYDEQELPPPLIARDERRFQLRAYKIWSDLLAEKDFPTLADFVLRIDTVLVLRSVLFEFSNDRRDPLIAFLGDELAAECGVSANERYRLSSIPKRSLLAQVAENYLPTVIQPTPIGFEAELVNQRERTIVHRGILLPFSEYGATIDFVVGVVSWKEVADAQTTDELLLELGQALGGEGFGGPPPGAASRNRFIEGLGFPTSDSEQKAEGQRDLATIGGKAET